MNNERRQEARLKTIDLLDYILIDKDGVNVDHSMGRTLDISQSGMLMETDRKLPIYDLIVVTLDLNENLIEVKGKVIHCHADAERYKVGIKFFDISEKDKKTFREFIENFQKDNPDARQNH